MKINKIGYHKNYNIIGMQWEKIIMEGELEEGEDEIESIQILRTKCDQSAQEKINSLYQEQGQYYNTPESIKNETGIKRVYSSSGNPFPEKTPEQAAQELIETATPSNIKWFKHLPEKYPQLKELYQQKLKELTNE